jgi:hypothetical protein
MALGEGIPQSVELWRIGLFGPAQKGTVWVNRGQVRAWQPDASCIWRENGVWDQGPNGAPRLLRPHHFTAVRGQAVDFGRDYLRPFINRYADSISAVAPRSIFFIETTPGFSAPQWGPTDAQPIVNAQHWYDMFTLMTKVFLPFFNVNIATGKPVFGVRAVQRMFVQQQQAVLADSAQRLGGAPTILGEFGTPFNMPLRFNLRFGWFGLQTLALNTYYRAIERNLLSAIIWNYTPDNSYCFGDGWNGEDLSLFSADQPSLNAQPPARERGVPAVVRPYAMRIAGLPIAMEFDLQRKRFQLTFRHNPAVSAPTEIFVPILHYPNGCVITVSDGTYNLDLPGQCLRYVHANERNEHTITITSGGI